MLNSLKGSIEFEVRWHSTDLEKEEHKVIYVVQIRFGESVMIYLLMYGDGMDGVNIHFMV